MPYLLNAFYGLLLLVFSPWLVVAAVRKGKYREGYAAKFLGLVPRRRGQQPCIWLHAVSVGEVNLLQPLVTRLTQRRPDLECVISTTTMTGYRLAKTRYPDLLVCYCPLDFSWAVRTALRRLRPALLVLAELELWPNLIGAAHERGVPVAVVNARLGEKSFRGYRHIRPLMTGLFGKLDLIAAQDARIAHRFVALGAPSARVHVSGSIKYDGAETDRRNSATEALRLLADFQPEDRVFLAGSTQAPEEALALATYRALAADHPELRLVLVPRHPDRFNEVATLLAGSGLPFQRRSRLDAGPAPDDKPVPDRKPASDHKPAPNHRPVPDRSPAPDDTRPEYRTDQRSQPSQLDAGPAPDRTARILLVDAVGELGAWWGTATIAFVGGSLTSRGGQNMIEPAAYGAAVSFGPNTWNFRDIAAGLRAARAAVVVRDGDEMTQFVRHCLDDPAYAASLGNRARDLVRQQQGATDRTINLLETLLDQAPALRPRATHAA